MKIGFACKFHSDDALLQKHYSFRTVTAKSLRGMSFVEAREKLSAIVVHNLLAVERLVRYVADLPESRRMLRLSGDILPLFTHGEGRRYYTADTVAHCGKLQEIGLLARTSGVRISFHPGQFTVLGSSNEGVVLNSIAELEYHTWLLTKMGYSDWHDHGCAINIHAGSRSVPLSVLRQNIGRLSAECRDFLTIENDEFSYGLTQIANELGDLVAIVPDLHHEWIYRGSYVAPDALEVAAAIASWRGVRPKLHCSMSRQEYFAGREGTISEPYVAPQAVRTVFPNLQELVASGVTKSKLRQHSDTMWNIPLMEYYHQFSDRFDIMVEAKHKQAAAEQLHSFFNSLQGQ